LKYGDSVVLGNGYVAPITKEVNTNGQESIVLDGSRLNTNLGVSFVTAANPTTVTFQNLTGQEVTIDRTQLPTGVDYNTGSLVYTNTLPFVFDQTSKVNPGPIDPIPDPIDLIPDPIPDPIPGPIDLIPDPIPDPINRIPDPIPDPINRIPDPVDRIPDPIPDPIDRIPDPIDQIPGPVDVVPGTGVDQPPIKISTPSTPPIVNPPGLLPPEVPVSTIQPPPAPPATFTPPVDLAPPSGLTPPDIPLSGVPSTTINVGGSPTIKVPPVVTTPPVTIVPTGGTPTTPTTWGYPNVPPPELPPYEPMPYPNYLRPLTPYLPLGIGALMEAMYAQEQGNGRYQPVQNAGGYFKIPT
jgi:hypothetical protein